MENANKLRKLDEFKAVLNGYRPSKNSLELLQNIPFVLLVGPTAAGRNTLINLLSDTGRYHFIVSDTTRQPRTNNGAMEQNGVEYWFKTEEEFLKGLSEGLYLEAAIIHNQQVSGISIAELERAHQSGRIAIDEIEVDGAAHIYEYKPDGLFVFLLPPTFDIWMERLRGRGQMDEAELRRRLTSARDEITAALENDFYQFVINNEIHEAAVAVDELANHRQPDDFKQRLGRDHAEQLVVDVHLFLSAD
jgi:guanylate kinase